MATTELELAREGQPLALRHELSIEEVLSRIHKVHQVMEKAMVEGHHYGKIPGTDKPTLLKPGAELLNVMFRLDPQYSIETIRDGEHLTILSTCTLWHIPTGQRWGSGMGSCSTRESKYAFRKAKRACPKCGAETINKSKFPPRGAPKGTEPGWYCYGKVGGCGEEFAANDPAIVDQQTGRVANGDLADAYNTVLKMANKRSLVAADLNVTAASDIFTQDLEDLPTGGDEAGLPRKGDVERRGADVHPSGGGGALDKQEAPGPSGQHETIEAQGDRLFDTDPAVAITVSDRNALLGRITACQDMLRAKGVDRVSAWKRYVGDYTEQNAPIEKLQAFLAQLQSVLPAPK